MNDLKKCPFCAEEIKTTAKKCKHCGEWLDKNDNIQTETSQPSNSDIIETEETPVLNKDVTAVTLWTLGVIVVIAFIIFMGNYHIITGSKSGMSIIKRTTFGFSEFFIPIDKITSMPNFSAMSQFPVGVKALRREGRIESHNTFNSRVEREAKKKFDKALKKAQDKFNQEEKSQLILD